MTFELHLPTLLLVSVTLNGLIGALLWWIYHLRGRQSCFRIWALACATFAIGSLLAGARSIIDAPLITIFLAHGLLGLSPLLVLNGLQGFSRLAGRHHRRFRQIAIAGFGVYLLLLLTTMTQSPVMTRGVTALYSALIFSVAVYRLTAIGTRVQLPVRVLQVLFTTHGILMMIQALVIAADVVLGVVNDLALILRLILINHILLATGTALALPLMAFSLSERRLRSLAERDSLTGLYNRRSLFREGTRAFSKSKASGSPLAVLMLDLDHFKPVNDRWGHAAGDDALRVVARTLESEVRDNDIVGRIGGEEFVIVLPLSCDENLSNITQRLLAAISAQGLEVSGLPMKLSASIGGVERHAEHKSFADMMYQADSALYTAKQNGRNRAELTDMPVLPAIL
jgi:diguanylate cyclase (GGDEF)-like protein